MRPRAVIFDFFGTLTQSASSAERHRGHARVAQALGVPTEEYAAAVRRSWVERATGRFGDLESTMRWLASNCGAEVTHERIAAACRERRRAERGYVRLRPEAEPTLQALTGRGFPLGLVSDCTNELPELWPTLPIAQHVDAPVFSVLEGVKKPDPAIFHRCCARLGVGPAECLYVGDGDSHELTGAQEVGMSPLRLVAPDHHDAHVIDPVTWTGLEITNLRDVLAHVDR